MSTENNKKNGRFNMAFEEFNLNNSDKLKITILNDLWDEYSEDYITVDPKSEGLVEKTVRLFVLTRTIENDEANSKILDFLYRQVASLNFEIFSRSAAEKIDSLLSKCGMLKISEYFKNKKQLKYKKNR